MNEKKWEFLIALTLSLAALVMAVWALLSMSPANIAPVQYACPMDAMVCPDGSTVGRTGPHCAFAACPGASSTASTTTGGAFCGGIAAIACPSGYACRLDGSFPDAGGHCVATTASAGVLQGKVTIGPFCPVERAGSPCPVPPEAYTSREVLVYDAAGKTLIGASHFNANGTYSLDLPPGTYVVALPSTGGIGGSGDLPKTVTIKAGMTTTLDFSIDTGIR